MFGFDGGDFIPFLVFSIPIIAIVGGITTGIIKTLGRQRLIELAQQERIAAIQRGIDVSKLPPLPNIGLDEDDLLGLSGPERDRRRAQGLLIAGIITLAVSAGLIAFFTLMEPGKNLWAVGIIPGAAGVALLLSALIVHPRGGVAGNPPSA
ncbi:MAG TPA: hypothetical protein VFQ05_09990 [Candidatus Eisenbacteria bacterium]|nr:hypothetical protein [Candidatus Eisenbacteria bacterium]